MDDFLTPGEANLSNKEPSKSALIKPGKSSQSFICPGIFTYKNGRVRLVIATS